MRLRHRVLLLLSTLLLGVVTALAVVAAGLLAEVAAAPAADLAMTLAVAERLLWLAAAAIAALGVGLGAVVSRLWLVAPIELLARETGVSARHGAAASVGSNGDTTGIEEIAILRHSLRDLRQRAREANVDRGSRLDTIQALLDRTADRLAAADRNALTGQLALGAAHELGSPLAIAVACVDSLRYGVVDELLRDDESTALAALATRYIDQIDDALGRVDAIVRELNAFGLPSRAPAEGRSEVARVAEICRTTLSLARLHSKCRGVQMSLHGAEEVADRAAAIAPRHLEQILLNLLINAADATANQGHVHLHISSDDAGMTVTVRDDGAGVPDAVKDRIFDPFYTSKAASVGSGLGLAVSRRLAQASGGQLDLADTSAAGSVFVLQLKI